MSEPIKIEPYFLPFHCPTFRTDHLTEPCQKNLARVKELRNAQKHIGPLERCVECKGKMLITKPRTVIEGLPEPENWVKERFLSESTPVSEEAWEKLGEIPAPNPEVTTDVGEKEPEKHQLSPEKVAKTRKAVQRMAERYKKPPKSEEILPELPEKQIETQAETRYCPKHPKARQRIDALGRWMGMCDECLSARGREAGIQNAKKGVTAPPMAIPLNLPKYAELKAWLEAQADEHERTLTQQIVFILKTAWRITD